MFRDLHAPSSWVGFAMLVVALACLPLAGCGSGSNGIDGIDGQDGSDGSQGPPGPPGPPGPTPDAIIDLATADPDMVAGLEVVSEVTNVSVFSPPVVHFRVETADGVPIAGIGAFWEESHRYVRFTITKLVPGVEGNPDRWVAYVRDEGEPDYDSGASLVDNGDGTYVFTFLTDVTAVPGVPYEPGLTHRIAGQIGSRSVPLPAQNLVYDFVPLGGPVTHTRKIVSMDSCNECHDGLVMHGRRFEFEYCTQCHNEDLGEGEGNMAFMIHRLHAGGTFNVITDHGEPLEYSHLTYPGNLIDCRKCHNGDDAATPQADNWRDAPNKQACGGCHTVFDDATHPQVPDPDNAVCTLCHTPESAIGVERVHRTGNATPNNPDLLDDQRNVAYQLVDASVNGSGHVVVRFRIYVDGVSTNVADLPGDLSLPNRYPSFLLAWAESQDGIESPRDFNNLGNRAGQPTSVGFNELTPLDEAPGLGSLAWDGDVNTAVITDPDHVFPEGAAMRTVGIQGYFRQDVDEDGKYEYSLHTPSAVVTVDGDTPRRRVVANDKCANCHEWFEGHGGNRVYEIAICTMCHVPNLSSSGRSIDPEGISGALLDEFEEAGVSFDHEDPLTYPEDAQNLRDMIHGIHGGHKRTAHYTHVRGGRQHYYDWDHVTFPAENGTANCYLCHEDGTLELPIGPGYLSTTVRTTYAYDGDDASTFDVAEAIASVPNESDWISTPTSASCYYCHTSEDAVGHMVSNGGLLSLPDGSWYTNRSELGTTMESCAVCHGPGRVADIGVVHGGD